jgi:hypothetical protein
LEEWRLVISSWFVIRQAHHERAVKAHFERALELTTNGSKKFSTNGIKKRTMNSKQNTARPELVEG